MSTSVPYEAAWRRDADADTDNNTVVAVAGDVSVSDELGGAQVHVGGGGRDCGSKREPASASAQWGHRLARPALGEVALLGRDAASVALN